jgi:hypothetical protein
MTSLAKRLVEAGAQELRLIGDPTELVTRIVLAFLRALQESGPSEGMIDAGRFEDGIVTAKTVWREMLSALISEIEATDA